jgi:hypothetical protein
MERYQSVQIQIQTTNTPKIRGKRKTQTNYEKLQKLSDKPTNSWEAADTDRDFEIRGSEAEGFVWLKPANDLASLTF